MMSVRSLLRRRGFETHWVIHQPAPHQTPQKEGQTLMDQPAPPRDAPQTSKEKNAVQREITQLLDVLAPERATARPSRLIASVQQHRTPNGCILQAADAALSVTWYVEAADRGRVGELQIVLWRGVVSRRGTAPSGAPAEVIQTEVLNPIERPTDECIWRSDKGTVYDTAGLAAHCTALLDSQVRATEP
jgi:hypothetical protein